MTEAVVYLILLPQTVVLAVNMYKSVLQLNHTDLWCLLFLLHAGFVRWIATLAVRSSSVSFQALASIIAAILCWLAFVVFFNKDFVLPTRQQTWALVMSIAVTALWEISTRMQFSLAA